MASGENWTSLLPGRNPVGGPGNTNPLVQATGSSSGANPVLPPNNIPSGAPRANPYDTTSVVPTFGANSGAYSPTNLAASAGGTGGSGLLPGGVGDNSNFAGMSPAAWHSLWNDLKKTYGAGAGGALLHFLQSGAGFNQDAINNLFAALQPGIERGTENLMEQFSTSGNRFGSGAQIGLADYLSQVQLNEGQLETQMYEQAIQNYLSVLEGASGKVASNRANSPGIFDKIGSILGIATSGAAGLSQGISAINPNANTNILDIIASLGNK